MKKVLLFCLTLLTLNVYSQSYWQNFIGVGRGEYAINDAARFKVEVAPLGNDAGVVAGNTFDRGAAVNLESFDSNGDTLWHRAFTPQVGDTTITISQLETVSDSIIYFGGQVDLQTYIIKTDGSGNFDWGNKLGSGYTVLDIKAFDNGDVFVVAVSEAQWPSSPPFFIPATLKIFRFNSGGLLLKSGEIEVETSDYIPTCKIVLESDSTIIMALSDENKVKILKLESLTSLRWVKEIAIGSEARVNDLIYTSDSTSLFIAGHALFAQRDPFVFEIDTAGLVQQSVRWSTGHKTSKISICNSAREHLLIATADSITSRINHSMVFRVDSSFDTDWAYKNRSRTTLSYFGFTDLQRWGGDKALLVGVYYYWGGALPFGCGDFVSRKYVQKFNLNRRPSDACYMDSTNLTKINLTLIEAVDTYSINPGGTATSFEPQFDHCCDVSSICSTTLPNFITEAKAYCDHNSVFVKWEAIPMPFPIEYSIEGSDESFKWELIRKHSGLENSEQQELILDPANSHYRYYRIRMHLPDGDEEISQAIATPCAGDGFDPSIQYQGNNLYLVFPKDLEEQVEYQIMDVSGKTLLNGSVNHPNMRKELGIEHFPKGIYLLRWEYQNESGTLKLIKT